MVKVRLKFGFSLVQTLLVVAIVASLSAVVVYTFKNDIKKARDTKRKSDFEAVAAALELYYQTNGNYTGTYTGDLPSGPENNWVFQSDASIPWVPGLTRYYIANLPRDPQDKELSRYYYQSDNDSGCPPAGQWIAIMTYLENEEDPDALRNKDVIWCDGTSLQGTYGTSYPNWYIKVIKAN